MTCPNCGAKLNINNDNNILFCPYCGTELPDERVRINKNYNTSYSRKDININRKEHKVKEDRDWTSIIAVGSFGVITVILILVVAIKALLQ